MNVKVEQGITNEKLDISKRFKALVQFTKTEEKELETVSQWYSKNFKLIYTIFFEALNHYNENTVKKKEKCMKTQDVLDAAYVLQRVFMYCQPDIKLKRQMRSIILYLIHFCDKRNVFQIQKAGFELLLNFMNDMLDQTDDQVMTLFMNALFYDRIAETFGDGITPPPPPPPTPVKSPENLTAAPSTPAPSTPIPIPITSSQAIPPQFPASPTNGLSSTPEEINMGVQNLSGSPSNPSSIPAEENNLNSSSSTSDLQQAFTEEKVESPVVTAAGPSATLVPPPTAPVIIEPAEPIFVTLCGIKFRQPKLIEASERMNFQPSTDAKLTSEEVLEIYQTFMDFIKTSENFEFWWKLFKERIAPFFYPNECKTLDLPNQVEDYGFTKFCPHRMHSLFLDLLMNVLENPKKAGVIYSAEKDINFMLQVFRQSFQMPPAYIEQVSKLIQVYRSWICRDIPAYTWPDIMENSKNVYFRVFIENLKQTFTMAFDDHSFETNLTMCYSVVNMLLFICSQPRDKLEFDTFSDALEALMATYVYYLDKKLNPTMPNPAISAQSNEKTGDKTKQSDKKEKVDTKQQQLNEQQIALEQEIGTIMEQICARELFLSWLKVRPGVEKEELWSAFYQLVQKSFSEDSIFSHWRVTLQNLTFVILKQMFKTPDENSGKIEPYCAKIAELPRKKGKGSKLTTTMKDDCVDESKLFLELSEDELLHLWQQMIKFYGLGDEETAGSLHAKKTIEICNLVEKFIAIETIEIKYQKGAGPIPIYHSPEGNRLLELFSEVLCEAAARTDSSFEEGRCHAIRTLCKLFCSTYSQQFKIEYLGEFYNCVNNALYVSKTEKTVEEVLLNSQLLFSKDHPGALLLIPPFMKAIDILMRDSSSAPTHLRLACVRILNSMFSYTFLYKNMTIIPTEFNEDEDENDNDSDGEKKKKNDEDQPAEPKTEETILKELVDSKKDIPFRSMKRLRSKIVQILQASGKDTRFPECQIISIWALLQILQKEMYLVQKGNMEVRQSSLKYIIDTILLNITEKNKDVATAAHQAIIALAELGLLHIIPSETVKEILLKFCNCIIALLKDPREIIKDLFYTMMEIIVEIPNEVFVDFSVSKVLFDALEQGILISQVAAAAVQGLGTGNAPAGPTPGSANSAKGSTASAGASNVSSGASSGANPQAAAISASKHATVSSGIGQMKLKLPDGKDVLMKEISEAAETLLCFCLNLLNMFPNKSGAEVISTNFSEFPYLPEKQDVSYPSPKVHHFCVQEDKLITIMESPKNPQSLRIIVRDMTGRYCWEHKLSMNEKASLFKFLDEKRNQNSAKAEELNSSLDVVSNKQHADGNVNKKVSDKNEKPQSESTKDKNAASDDEEEDDEKSVAGLTPAQELEKDNETLTNNDNDDDEDELIEEEPTDYPKYHADIDTNKTDMLELFQGFVSQVFPECGQYRKRVIKTIEDLQINYSPYFDQMDNQSRLEQTVLEMKKQIADSASPAAKNKELRLWAEAALESKQESSVFKTFRMFLSTLGLLSIKNVKNSTLSRLKVDHMFYRFLRQLDKIKERETIKVGVVYVANGQEREREIFKNLGGSDAYKEFLQGLGWDVDLSTHTGFYGGLDNTPGLGDGKFAPYYCNPTTEVLFHVITKMPKNENETQQIHIKKHVGNDHVHIIWSEHDRDYNPSTILSQFNFVHIVIYPLRRENLFRIQIFHKPGVPPFGPLQDGMVVSKEVLPGLVRLTAINANKAVRYKQAGYQRPHPTRKMKILEIIQKFKTEKSQFFTAAHEYLEPLFIGQVGTLEEDAHNPNLIPGNPDATSGDATPAASLNDNPTTEVTSVNTSSTTEGEQ